MSSVDLMKEELSSISYFSYFDSQILFLKFFLQSKQIYFSSILFIFIFSIKKRKWGYIFKFFVSKHEFVLDSNRFKFGKDKKSIHFNGLIIVIVMVLIYTIIQLWHDCWRSEFTFCSHVLHNYITIRTIKWLSLNVNKCFRCTAPIVLKF